MIFVGAVLFSTKAVLVKLAYREEIDTISLLALRMLFALPIYLLVAYFSDRRHAAKVSRKDYGYIALFGAMGYYMASLLDFMGLRYITAGLERLILFVYPTLVLFLSALFLGKSVTSKQLLALVLTYGGILVTFIDPYTFTDNEEIWKGSLLVFGAAFAYAAYLVGSGSMVARIGTMRYTSLAMSAACIAVLIHHGISAQWDLFDFSWDIYRLALLMAIIATVLPSFLIMEGIRIIGSSNASIIGSVGPISTIVMAYLFLDERFGYLQALGTFLVIGGILIISLSKKDAKVVEKKKERQLSS